MAIDLSGEDSILNRSSSPSQRLENGNRLVDDPVKGVKQLLDEGGLAHVPERYICAEEDRPDLSQVGRAEIPVIDLAGLLGDGKRQVIEAIGHACQEWGVFQVINHGVAHTTVEDLWAAVHEFFQLSADERMQWYSRISEKPVVYFPIASKDWTDSLMFRLDYGDPDFKQAPVFAREPVLEYFKEMRKFTTRICDALSESLGLSRDRLETWTPSPTDLKIYHYSACPEPSLTLGKGRHTDPNLFTFLMAHDMDPVGGLQVLKEGRWIAVKPLPNSYIVNMGDQMQILTNGKYQSVEHRVAVNSYVSRNSVACFICPPKDACVAPIMELVNEKNPPRYKEIMYIDYVKTFMADITRKHALNHIEL